MTSEKCSCGNITAVMSRSPRDVSEAFSFYDWALHSRVWCPAEGSCGNILFRSENQGDEGRPCRRYVRLGGWIEWVRMFLQEHFVVPNMKSGEMFPQEHCGKLSGGVDIALVCPTYVPFSGDHWWFAPNLS